MSQLCDEQTLNDLTEALDDASDPIERIDEVLQSFPEDARLHFLRGSLLITRDRPIEAHQSLSRAVALAPDFAIARFQFGLFQLTSGEANKALETWGPLDRLAQDHYLRRFADGLRSLIRDEFADAVAMLREGILLNQENMPLNRDMQMLIDKCEPLTSVAPTDDAAAASSTTLILQQFKDRSDMH